MRALLATAALCAAASAAIADDHGTIRLTVSPGQSTGGNGGGEFGVVAFSDVASLPRTGPHVDDPGRVFQTFCLETNESLAFATDYDWTRDEVAIRGGVGGGSPDPLDARTAWLFTQFWDGTLAGYSYAQGSARAASATSLQLAIWKIEDEVQPGPLGDAYAADAQAQTWVAAATAAVSSGAWRGLGDVRVLNLVDHATHANAQSLLVRGVSCRVGFEAAVSLGGGETIALCAEDFDLDARPDLLNLTPETAQIFHDDGVVGGTLHFTMTQEFPVDHGRRGCCMDVDDDGDCDLVLGDADYIIVATNDGRGRFSPTRAYAHHFGVSTIAVPFDTFTDPRRPGNRHRVFLAGTSAVLDPTAVGVPDTRPWAVILEFGPGGVGLTPIQLLDPIAADDVIATDLDGDGDVDLVISNRSGTGERPLEIYESLAADMPGGLFVHAPPLDFLDATYDFGFGIALASDGSLAVGSWHRSYLLRRDATFTGPRLLTNPSRAWLPSIDVLIDPTRAWQSAEAYAVGFGDFDCDGRDDLVMQGWHTPLVAVTLVDGVETGRFVAPPTPGIARDLVVLDWDLDAAHAKDVIVGGTAGLFFYRNRNGGDAAPGPSPSPAPTTPECNDDVYAAAVTLDALLSPTHVPALLDPDARVDVAQALAELDSIDPRYLVSGAFALPDPPLDQIQSIFTHLQAAHAKLVAAAAQPGLGAATIATLSATADRLVGASACLADEAIAMGGPAPKSLRVRRLLSRATNDADAAATARTASQATTRPRVASRLARLAISRNLRAFRRAVAAWRAAG